MTRRIGSSTLVIATHNAGKLKEISVEGSKSEVDTDKLVEASYLRNSLVLCLTGWQASLMKHVLR